MKANTQFDPLLSGFSSAPGIVAVEHIERKDSPDEIAIFQRKNGATERVEDRFEPFVWLQAADLLDGWGGEARIEQLAGDAPLKSLAFFESWHGLKQAVDQLKKKTKRTPTAPDAPYFFINDPVQQYLMLSGKTFFKDMAFSQVKRMQVDIETYTEPGFEFSNPDRDADRIIAIAMADESGWTQVLSGVEMDEKTLLEQFVQTVQERDPDVIEGHNFFRFDMPFIITRAKKCKVSLRLGRDKSVPATRASRFSVAERTVSYPRAAIFGRHIVDTYFLVQIYDISHRSLNSFGLKDVAIHFGIDAPERTYIDGSRIASMFDSDPEQLMKYARDDILETRSLGDLLSPIYFAQAQLLPFTYQNISVRGNAAKIDALLLREYLRQKHAIPTPDAAREFAGGYTDIFFEGVAENVHHCDIRSLYPSLMLQQRIAPTSDELGIFLTMLDSLRTFRLKAKEQLKSASEDERHYLDALQSTFKVLINSFYGYLGFSMGRFNDYAAAAKIAEEGRTLLKRMIEWINEHGGHPIEIDTDGIYFVPPSSGIEDFRQAFREWLPAGIEIEFDGEYKAMYSYKMKNYALLCDNDEVIIKGAALKSRGLEPFQRDFLRELVTLRLKGRDRDIPALRRSFEDAISQAQWHVKKLAKTERLQNAPSAYEDKINEKERGRNAAYELALKSDRAYKAGDQVSYYVTGNKKSVAVYEAAKLVSDWDPENRDENIPYYLAKLDALCKKFDVGNARQQELF
ncbi:MAG: DNA polymerase II [Spartobacteria bacterium]|nr:DNA polymerase II [Spartobacteria bacterium]